MSTIEQLSLIAEVQNQSHGYSAEFLSQFTCAELQAFLDRLVV